MIISFHTKSGIIQLNSDNCTLQELANINLDRAKLDKLLVPDLYTELKQIKQRLDNLELKQ